MNTRLLSRFFSKLPRAISSPPRSEPHRVEPLEDRIAPAAILLTGIDGNRETIDFGDGDFTLKAGANKVRILDSALNVVWSHGAPGIDKLAIDAGSGDFTVEGWLNKASKFSLTGTGDLSVSGKIIAGNSISIEGGLVMVSGSLISRDAGGHGGNIVVTGENVALIDHARASASGANGGGSVLIGGDYQGGNSAVHNATHTFIGADVAIHADALRHGSGGKVIVWGNEGTKFFGTITARGLSGAGGFVETSGSSILAFGSVDVS